MSKENILVIIKTEGSPESTKLLHYINDNFDTFIGHKYYIQFEPLTTEQLENEETIQILESKGITGLPAVINENGLYIGTQAIIEYLNSPEVVSKKKARFTEDDDDYDMRYRRNVLDKSKDKDDNDEEYDHDRSTSKKTNKDLRDPALTARLNKAISKLPKSVNNQLHSRIKNSSSHTQQTRERERKTPAESESSMVGKENLQSNEVNDRTPRRPTGPDRENTDVRPDTMTEDKDIQETITRSTAPLPTDPPKSANRSRADEIRKKALTNRGSRPDNIAKSTEVDEDSDAQLDKIMKRLKKK